MKQFRSAAVVGAGQMGAGIAQVLAQSGIETYLLDAIPAGLERGYNGIVTRLDKAIEKGKLDPAGKDRTLSFLRKASSLQEVKHVDLLIEAIVENFEDKAKLFREADLLCGPETIFASNTSSISITRLAGTTKRSEQFIGMHFMNPVPVMKLVEIIRGLQTSDKTYEAIRQLTLHLEKTPVTARRDYPGFIVNRILVPMINEAIFALQEGIATPEEIDQAMKLGTNQPMGPLELADFVGLDTCLYILQVLHRELGEDKFRPCPLLVKYVEAGWYGRKAGRGFYKYGNA